MDTPYHVETIKQAGSYGENVETAAYAITRAGEDYLCRGPDLVFMHRLVELLNADEHAVEGR